MKVRHTAAVTLTAATLGVALLTTAPAQAGVIIPQVHQAGVIIHDAGIVMDDVTSFPPGPTFTDATTAA